MRIGLAPSPPAAGLDHSTVPSVSTTWRMRLPPADTGISAGSASMSRSATASESARS